MLLASLACLAPGFHRFSAQLLEFVETIAEGRAAPSLPPFRGDGISFVVVTLVILLATVWMVALMWHSFTRVTQRRGDKAIGAFVVVLILAEVLSKVLVAGVFQLVSARSGVFFQQ